MTSRPLKFSVNLFGDGSVPEMVKEGRRAEAAGFDVVTLPDQFRDLVVRPGR